MGNRKENIKKTLGISEYPWSSDEDENDVQPVINVHLLRRQLTEPRPSVADAPGTSSWEDRPAVEPPISAPTPPTGPSPPGRRAQSKLSKDLVWLILKNRQNGSPSMEYSSRPHSGTTPSPGTSQSQPTAVDRERLDRERTQRVERDVAKIQRILEHKRLTRTFNNLRQNRATSGLFSLPPRSIASRNPIFYPSLAARNLPNLRINRPHFSFKRSNNGRLLLPTYNVDNHDIRPSLSQVPPPPPPPPGVEESQINDQPASEMIRSQLTPSPTNPEGADINQYDDEEERSSSPPITTAEENNPPQGTAEVPAEIPPNNDLSLEEVVIVEENEQMDVEQNDEAADKRTDEPTASTSEGAAEVGIDERDGEGLGENKIISVEEFNLGLLKLLECPVCLECMEPPMSQCRRGHLVCSHCRIRLITCPVCRTGFSSVRNRAMEGVAEMLRYPCRHGCGREVRLRRRGPHEANCTARRYPCPVPSCGNRPPMLRADLSTHFQVKHPSTLKYGRRHMFTMKVNAEQHENWVLMSFGECFHLRIDIDILTWGVIIYVTYLGPKANARKYTYSVTVDSVYNSRKLVYTRATHSDLENSSQVASLQDCFHLTHDQAVNFLRFENRRNDPDKFLCFALELDTAYVHEQNWQREDSET